MALSTDQAGRQSGSLDEAVRTRKLEQLMAEYVFAFLIEAAVEFISSENAARFAAMESAHDNVTKKLSRLRQSAQQARQTEIAADLLDLIAGP
jgi:F-type H+-transporting ATPase subunit gamma